MSGHVMDVVWQHFDQGGAMLLIALAIGDFCGDDEGTSIYPSVSSLAAKTRQSERTVQRQLHKLQKSGWLILLKAEKGKTKRYRIDPAFMALGGDMLSRRRGVRLSRRGDKAESPELKGTRTFQGKSNDHTCACGADGVTSTGVRWYCRSCDPMRQVPGARP